MDRNVDWLNEWLRLEVKFLQKFIRIVVRG